MPGYVVRLINGGEPVAVVSAESIKELFWVVDEATDPSVCEFKKMPSPGGCDLAAPNRRHI